MIHQTLGVFLIINGLTFQETKMNTASEDAKIHAEAIVKAACIKAATDLIISGRVDLPPASSKYNVQYAVARYAMDIWENLEKPKDWPA
jgi:hypothetical protein